MYLLATDIKVEVFHCVEMMKTTEYVAAVNGHSVLPGTGRTRNFQKLRPVCSLILSGLMHAACKAVEPCCLDTLSSENLETF